MSDLVLYSYWRSSCSFRVRIALNLKGLPYEYRGVHLVRDGGEQNKQIYRDINPLAQVPSLVHEGRVLTQSMAIAEYLDDIHPEPALFPADPFDAARVRAACEVINAGIQPLQNLRLLQELARRYQVDDEMKADWSRFWMARGLAALEVQLAKTAGDFSFGDTATAADSFLVPQLYNARRFALDLAPYPTVTRVEAHCLTQGAFVAAAPERQPDAPENLG